MTNTGTTIDRIAPAKRPAGNPAGHHNWLNILFVHWRASARDIADLLPARLTVDTFDGSAWLGLVPFTMAGVRPWWSPPIPVLSSFHETNVRTYVHLDGQDPGVWFFSLDASSSLAVRIARWRWRLNYFRADMHLNAADGKVYYHSERLWPGPVGPGTRIEAEVGDLIGALDKNVPPGQAVPGTLEHFLIERYVLYTQGRQGELLRGRVHHRPYPLCEANLLEFDESLLKQAGVKPRGDVEHVLFSEGVKVEVFPLKKV